MSFYSGNNLNNDRPSMYSIVYHNHIVLLHVTITPTILSEVHAFATQLLSAQKITALNESSPKNWLVKRVMPHPMLQIVRDKLFEHKGRSELNAIPAVTSLHTINHNQHCSNVCLRPHASDSTSLPTLNAIYSIYYLLIY